MANTLNRFAYSIAALVATVAVLVLAAPAAAAEPCTKYAAPSGSDSAAGSEQAPYRTAQKLAYSLRAGDTGCLRTGTYSENVELTEAGTESARITLRSHPGERATIVGELAVRAGADHVTVSNLDLNGKNSGNWPSPAVSSDHVVFEDNDVTNDHTTICFLLGTATRARGTIIRRNRIHDCGKLPATNLHEGIYVQHADDTQILDNHIYDNADMGIQLYPDAQHTLVRGNVIDGNGEGIIFSGDHGLVASDNVVENNVITNSRIRDNVESYYEPGTPVGENNIVRNNCVYGAARRNFTQGEAGFTTSNNVVADPKFVDRAGKDFSLAADSPCAGLLSQGGQPADPPAQSPAPPQGGGGQSGGGHVTLQIPPVVSQAVQSVPASGQVIVPQVQQQQSAPKRTVLVQRRTKRGWRTVARAKVGRGSRFRTRVRVRARRGQRVVRMRAVVRTVASSRVRRVRVRHS